MSVLGALSIAGMVGDTLNSLYNDYWSRDMQERIFNQQKYIDSRNFEYQKNLNQQIMDREDNAVQRRAADLQAAGISKHLAAGSSAQASTMSYGSGSVGSASGVHGNSNISEMLMSIGNVLSDIRLKNTQRKNIESDTVVKNQEAINKSKEAGLITQQEAESLSRTNLNNAMKEGQIINNRRQEHDYNIDKDAGTKSNEIAKSEYITTKRGIADAKNFKDEVFDKNQVKGQIDTYDYGSGNVWSKSELFDKLYEWKGSKDDFFYKYANHIPGLDTGEKMYNYDKLYKEFKKISKKK